MSSTSARIRRTVACTTSLRMYPWSHASSDATTYTASTSIRTSPTAAKSTPCPGTRFSVLAIRSACRTSPCARSASAACSCVVPSGMLRPRTPAKIRSVARPRIRGPIDISATLTTASSRTMTTLTRCGLSCRTSRLADGPNALAFWPTMPPPIGPRPGPAPWVIRSVSLSWPGLSADLVSLMPPPPRSAGTRRSPGTSWSCASSSWCVPRSTTTPSSSTRITSASRIVETRWATISTVASRVTGRRAARSRASVARSRAEKESSNR